MMEPTPEFVDEVADAITPGIPLKKFTHDGADRYRRRARAAIEICQRHERSSRAALHKQVGEMQRLALDLANEVDDADLRDRVQDIAYHES